MIGARLVANGTKICLFLRKHLKCILKYDRKGDRFIPLCTRNLFLKYYTDSEKVASYLDSMRWNRTDREGYMNAIHEVVDPIFDSVVIEDKETKI